MRCGIWYHLYNLRHVKNTHGGVLILICRLKACNFTKINTPPWVFFTFFKLSKWYQIMQRITHVTSKISNPAISSTPMKYDLLSLVSNALFTRATIHQNIRSNKALDKAATEYKTWLTFCPLFTNSLPTFTLGLHKDLWNSPTGSPSKYATLSPSIQNGYHQNIFNVFKYSTANEI